METVKPMLVSDVVLVRGAGFEVVWPHFLAIISIGTVFFLVALGLFRKSVNMMQ